MRAIFRLVETLLTGRELVKVVRHLRGLLMTQTLPSALKTSTMALAAHLELLHPRAAVLEALDTFGSVQSPL